MNIAQDYVWYGKDKNWQEDYAVRLQGFLRSKGIDTFEDQFNPDGTTPDFILGAGGFKKLRHSLGLKSTAATASLIGNDKKSLDFVHSLWNGTCQLFVTFGGYSYWYGSQALLTTSVTGMTSPLPGANAGQAINFTAPLS